MATIPWHALKHLLVTEKLYIGRYDPFSYKQTGKPIKLKRIIFQDCTVDTLPILQVARATCLYAEATRVTEQHER